MVGGIIGEYILPMCSEKMGEFDRWLSSHFPASILLAGELTVGEPGLKARDENGGCATHLDRRGQWWVESGPSGRACEWLQICSSRKRETSEGSLLECW